jgi:hypothetical protein
MAPDLSQGLEGCIKSGEQPRGAWLVEPIGGNGLDCNRQQLDGCGQVPGHRRRLEPQSSSVCEGGTGEFPG